MLYGTGGSPIDGGLQGQDVILQQLDHRPQAELGIAEETQQQFHGAVAGSSSQSSHRGIHAIGTQDDGFDRVGEGQLLIVVGMDADLFVGPFQARRCISCTADRFALGRGIRNYRR